ncbi:MAG: hypothetical protein DRN30_02285 [Thermoplasmata archaeon]|nr:MAG: hypothetical protein DRN30_02285 [Thermoplasmata archaeon]
MANLIAGKDLLVAFGTSGSESQIFCSTTCTLNINQATIAASCKDNDGNWEQNIAGIRSWEVTVDGLYQLDSSESYVDISDLILSDTNQTSLVFGQSAGGVGVTGEVTWSGDAVCTSASLTGADGEIATWSCTFKGTGELAKTVVS